MGDASYIQPSFAGGEVSKLAQGRIDRPDYRTLMNVCLNGLPTETGAWVRRPGSRLNAVSRNGQPARTQSFDFKTGSPYTIEFTDGVLRFFTNTQLAKTNDKATVTAISAANPAEVTTAANHGWSSNNTVYFGGLGTNSPLLHNRPFLITVTAANKFTIRDAITGATISGATLGVFVSGTVARVLELTTPYPGVSWQTVRVIKADIPVQQGTTPGAVILGQNTIPYVLQVAAAPTDAAFATFALAPAPLKDGPYLEIFTNGVQAAPSGFNGVITITLAFAAYDSGRAYSVGDYVTSAAVNYRSLTDANQGNAPAGSPSNWVSVSGFEAVGGFQGTDLGRHVRLHSEPKLYSTTFAYLGGEFVAFGGTGLAFTGATYWKAIAASTGIAPGTDVSKWVLAPASHIWTWGKIVGFTNEISRTLAGSVAFGDLTSGGGVAAAFDGNFSQSTSQCAANVFGGGLSGTGYVGKNYSGASAQQIASCTVWPATTGFFFPPPPFDNLDFTVTLNLRAKATLPGSSSDGTLLGTTSFNVTTGSTVPDFFPANITSSDPLTAWNYVWVEVAFQNHLFTFGGTMGVSEVQFFNPAGTGITSGVKVQIIGDALIFNEPVRQWRLGLYSGTTGWPTCGTYHEGRVWLSGLVGNRIDASRANDIFNFAPTEPDGTVSASNGIAYTFNAPDVNTILWMDPDQNGIVCGTGAGEWLVQASALNQPLTPTSIQAHRAMRHKCANIEPRRTGLTLCAVQAAKRSLLEFFPDVYSGKFGADNLAEEAKHITKGNIAELAFTSELTPILWVRKEDGTLVGLTYRRKTLSSSQRAEIRGWHRHTLGSARQVEFISSGPAVGGLLDALTMVTNGADNVRHVETMNDILDEGAALAQAAYLDDAVTPTAFSIDPAAPAPAGGLTLFGLWPLNGKTVTAWLGGLDCGDYLVTNGQITVPFGDGISGGTATGMFTAAFVSTGITAFGDVMFTGTMPALVGFSYNSDGQIVRPSQPAESGARSGPAFGKKRRNHQFAIQVEGTQGTSVGTEFTTGRLKPILFKTKGEKAYRVSQQFTGIHWDTIVDDESFDGMICWRVSRPYICNIAAVGGFIQTQDK
ncbi:MAG TPA: hypothetical protein VF901_21880 [Bradyrhizobium sp.]